MQKCHAVPFTLVHSVAVIHSIIPFIRWFGLVIALETFFERRVVFPGELSLVQRPKQRQVGIGKKGSHKGAKIHATRSTPYHKGTIPQKDHQDQVFVESDRSQNAQQGHGQSDGIADYSDLKVLFEFLLKGEQQQIVVVIVLIDGSFGFQNRKGDGDGQQTNAQ